MEGAYSLLISQLYGNKGPGTGFCVKTEYLAMKILITDGVAGKHPACDWF